MRSIQKSLQPAASSSRGFTLMEVLLVLAILGVIAAMVVPNLLGRQRAANISATRNSIASLENTFEMYAVDHDGSYPTTAEGFMVLIQNPGSDKQWKGPYLKNTNDVPKDAWGQPMNYAFPGQRINSPDRPDIYSNGPDKTPNTDDDIGNWTPIK